MSDKPRGRITDPRLTRVITGDGSCDIEADNEGASGETLMCWLEAGHEGDHYDVVDGSWIIEEEEAK